MDERPDDDGVDAESVDLRYSSPKARSARSQTKAAKRRWDRFLALIGQGLTIAEACAEVGVSERAFWNTKERHPEFAARYKMLRERQRAAQRAGREQGPGWSGTSYGFAVEFIPPPEDSGIDWPNEPYTYSFFQHQVTDALDNCAEGDVVLVKLPPGGRKTTTLENWIIKEVALNPEIRIGYISKSSDHAIKSCDRIRSIMHDDPTLAPDLIARFGPFKEHGQDRRGKPWSTKRFTVAGKTSSTRDYTFAAAGAGNQLYGSRFDCIILDDFQTNQNIDQTEKLLWQFQFEILSRRPTGSKNGKPRGRVVIIGTAIEAGDFYDRLEDEFAGEDWFHVVDFPVVGTDGMSLDPECFPDAVLPQMRKQVGERVWATSYMQRPPSKQNPTFPESDRERSKRPALLLGWRELRDGTPVETGMPDMWDAAIGLDPNLGAGYTSLLTAGFSIDRFRVLDHDERYGLSRTEDILDMLEEHLQRYPEVSEVRVEINAFQRGFARDDRLMGNPGKGIVGLRQKYGIQIREHTTTGYSKDDDQIGVSRMSKMFIQSAVDIPWGDDDAIRKMEPLLMELGAWRPKMSGKKLKQDRIMAMWFAWLVWQERRGNQERSANASWRTQGVPGRATPYRPMTVAR
jgi:hypothetical protein